MFMRIAIFTETYLPYINGVVTHIKILREGLIKMGHQVLIVTADTDRTSHYLKDGILRCPALEFKKLYGYGLASPVSHTLERMIREFNPDIIHIEQEFGLGLQGIRCAKRFHIPLVYTLHTLYDYYVYYIAPKPFTEVVKKISHRYIRFIARRADVITGPSQKCADYLKNAGVNKKVHVIPNPVEVESYSRDAVSPEDRSALREKLGIPQNAFLGCFCGRLGKEKMVDELLDIYKNCTDDSTCLLVIGDGPSRKELEALAESLGIQERIKFTGALPHDELVPYYAICDFYATASVSDTYSISMLEAQASGLYVLQKYDIKNSYQTRTGVNGELFKDPEEFKAILDKLRAMSQEDREALEDKVRDSVKERSSKAIAESMTELYRQAIEKKKRQRI